MNSTLGTAHTCVLGLFAQHRVPHVPAHGAVGSAACSCTLPQAHHMLSSRFVRLSTRCRHFPEFLDLVVWGHEHECRADPEAITSAAGASKFDARPRFIVQPGSSVATALSEGESKKKHAVLLEVRARQLVALLW